MPAGAPVDKKVKIMFTILYFCHLNVLFSYLIWPNVRPYHSYFQHNVFVRSAESGTLPNIFFILTSRLIKSYGKFVFI